MLKKATKKKNRKTTFAEEKSRYSLYKDLCYGTCYISTWATEVDGENRGRRLFSSVSRYRSLYYVREP